MKLIKVLIQVLIFSFTITSAVAQKTEDQSGFTVVSSSIRYKLIGIYELDRLNAIQTKEIPLATGINPNYTPAKNAVKLYRVEYSSVIPEQENRPTVASGLIAIPATGAKVFPLVSYQHGTVFGKHEVPSFPEESFETRLMVAQFAGQGYVVIGADYFGMGTSKESDSYMVMKSHQQACYDMYEAAKVILSKEQISTTDFFITGWSQGGVVTMSFLEKLEGLGVKVKAAGTASAQCDGYVMSSTFLNFPRKIDAPWVTTVFILTAFSFETYYQMPGLAKGLFNDDLYEISKKIYLHDTTVAYKDYPTDLHKLIRPEYFNPVYLKQSAYGKLLSDMHPYRWVIKTPVRMYYGDMDESFTAGLAKLPMEFQKAMGNNIVEAFSTGADNNHRMTYANAVPKWKAWFDSLITK